MRLALFTPLSRASSGIAEYGRRLQKELEGKEEVDVFVDELPSSSGVYSWRDFAWRDLRAPYDLTVYHVANHLSYAYVYPFVFHRAGVLVLHDLVLHPSRLAGYFDSHELLEYKASNQTAHRRDAAQARLNAYREEVRATYPERGAWLAEILISIGGGRLLRHYPLYELLVRSSKMTLVHSASAKSRVEATSPGSAVRLVPLGVDLPEPVTQEQARRDLALPAGFLLVCISDEPSQKRVPVALRAVKRLVDLGVDLRCFVAGRFVGPYDPVWDAGRLGISERVSVVEDTGANDLTRHASAADLCLDLRDRVPDTPSASLLRLLGTGRAVLVMNTGYAEELPIGVVARVDPPDETGLFRQIRELLEDPARRHALGSRARDHVQERHRFSHMVRKYLFCLDEAQRLPGPSTGDLPTHLAGLRAVWPDRITEYAHRTGCRPDELRRFSHHGVRIPCMRLDREMTGTR